MIKVRPATPADAEAIWLVHASDIDKWVTASGDLAMEALLSTDPESRWREGGPWMSPDTCLAHLHALEAAGQLALVVESEGQVVGELELIIGPDFQTGGLKANVSVLYVLRKARGRGLGTALLTAATAHARNAGCRSISVFNPSPRAESLYRRLGLTQVSLYEMVHLPGRHSLLNRVRVTPAPLPPFSELSKMGMWLGHFQTDYQCWQQLKWQLPPGLFELHLPAITPRMVVRLHLPQVEDYAWAVFQPLGSNKLMNLYLWADQPRFDWVKACLSCGRRLGFRKLGVMADTATCRELRLAFGGEKRGENKQLSMPLIDTQCFDS